MDSKIDFLYLSEPDMIKAGVKDMKSCVDVMEDLLITLYKGDYVMGGANHNSHVHDHVPGDPSFLECRRMQMTEDLWQCRRIWAAAIRWLE